MSDLLRRGVLGLRRAKADHMAFWCLVIPPEGLKPVVARPNRVIARVVRTHRAPASLRSGRRESVDDLVDYLDSKVQRDRRRKEELAIT